MSAIEINTWQYDVTIDIGTTKECNEYSISSNTHPIYSISMTYGCYDGNAPGIGFVYFPSVTISMQESEYIKKDRLVKITFETEEEETEAFGKTEVFGIFYVKETPTRSNNGDISVTLGGMLERQNSTKIWSDLVIQDDNLIKKKGVPVENILNAIEEICGKKINLSAMGAENVEKLKNTMIITPTFLAEVHSGTPPVARNFLAGIGIIAGGNFCEFYDEIRFFKKGYELGGFLNDREYTDYTINETKYQIESITVQSLPVKKETASDIFLSYYGNERNQFLCLGSATEGTGNEKYKQEIECDWVTAWHQANAIEPQALFASILQGDLIFRTGNIGIVGLANITPGALVKVKTTDWNAKYYDVYAGEVTFEWDGGFTTKISSSCNIDSATKTARSSTESKFSSSSNAAGASANFNENMFAKKDDLKKHIDDKNIHINAEEVFENAYSYRIGTSGTQSGMYALVAAGLNNTASGLASHAEGDNTVAAGPYSHSEGYNTKAIGESSHAEGETTEASYFYAHSEGSNTKASGNASHAEGFITEASGEYSYAGGRGSKASSIASHAEGMSTNATGEQSHSEGKTTSAIGKSSHSEGETTSAIGKSSHSEGYITEASGPNSHSEGSNTKAAGTSSHAEGNRSKSEGSYSHAEGSGTEAKGTGGHAEGFGTIAYGEDSHSEGISTIAAANASHAEGIGTVSIEEGQHVQGKYNSHGSFAHVVGGGTSDSDRKNIHFLDWYGNAWFAGDVITKSGVTLNTIGFPESVDIDFSNYFT